MHSFEILGTIKIFIMVLNEMENMCVCKMYANPINEVN